MRVSSGVHGFDQLVDGGFIPNRLYVVSGPPGSGKTTFCSQFVAAGARDGGRCLYMSMHETKQELVDDMAGYDFGFGEIMESSRVYFLNIFSEQSENLVVPRETGDYRSNVQNMSSKIVGFVNNNDIDRLVIDSTMLLRYFYSTDSETFIQFVSSLKRTDATTLLISEMTDPTAYSDEHYLAHGVVFLHNYLDASGMQRGVQIVKMRGTPIDADIREIEFTESGLRVHPGRTVER